MSFSFALSSGHLISVNIQAASIFQVSVSRSSISRRAQQRTCGDRSLLRMLILSEATFMGASAAWVSLVLGVMTTISQSTSCARLIQICCEILKLGVEGWCYEPERNEAHFHAHGRPEGSWELGMTCFDHFQTQPEKIKKSPKHIPFHISLMPSAMLRWRSAFKNWYQT